MEGKCKEGKWISYYNTGKKWSIVYFSNGKRNGKAISWYPSSDKQKRYEGQFKNYLEILVKKR